MLEQTLLRRLGNITLAARDLGVPPGDLRKLALVHPTLLAAALEAQEQLIDQAEAVVVEALISGEPSRADPMSRFVLSTYPTARERGWNPAGRGGAGVSVSLTWADPSTVMIDATPVGPAFTPSLNELDGLP